MAVCGRSSRLLPSPTFRAIPVAKKAPRAPAQSILSAPVRANPPAPAIFQSGRARQPKTRPQASGAEGRAFESRRAYQNPRKSAAVLEVRIPLGVASGTNVAPRKAPRFRSDPRSSGRERRSGRPPGRRSMRRARALQEDLTNAALEEPASAPAAARGNRVGVRRRMPQPYPPTVPAPSVAAFLTRWKNPSGTERSNYQLWRVAGCIRRHRSVDAGSLSVSKPSERLGHSKFAHRFPL